MMEPRNPTSAVLFQNQMHLFFSKTNLQYLEPTFGMVGAKHTQTDTHDRFSKSLYLLRL